MFSEFQATELNPAGALSTRTVATTSPFGSETFTTVVPAVLSVKAIELRLKPFSTAPLDLTPLFGFTFGATTSAFFTNTPFRLLAETFSASPATTEPRLSTASSCLSVSLPLANVSSSWALNSSLSPYQAATSSALKSLTSMEVRRTTAVSVSPSLTYVSSTGLSIWPRICSFEKSMVLPFRETPSTATITSPFLILVSEAGPPGITSATNTPAGTW